MNIFFITIAITFVQIPALILRYLPFSILTSRGIKKKLFISYGIFFIIQNIFIYFYYKNFAVDITSLSYKRFVFVFAVIYVVLSMVIIKGFFFQHLFIFGMQGGYSLIIHTIGALIISKTNIINMEVGEQFLIQSSLYIILFTVITIPLWFKIKKTLIFNPTARDEYYWKIIWIIPMLIVYSDSIATMNTEWIHTWQQILSRIMTGIALYFSWRVMNLDFGFLEEISNLRNINKIQHMKEVSIDSQAEIIRENDHKIRILKHDMRHYLNIISTMIKHEQYDGALQVISDVNASIQNTELIEYCKDPLINAALLIYISRAKELGIDISNDINIPEELPWNGNDIGILFANALENAVNASMKQPEDKREIKINTRYFENKLVIKISNRFNGEIYFDKNGYPKSCEKDHGFGIISIRSIVDKYHGHMSFTKQGDWFKISLMLSELSH